MYDGMEATMTGNQTAEEFQPLFHYTEDENLVLNRTHRYTQGDPHEYAKPGGLWLSAGPAWREWREGAEWGIPRVEYVYEVALAPTANILTLTTDAELRRLADQFPNPDYDELMKQGYSAIRRDMIGPSWKLIGEKYDGILIPEYHWSCRMEVSWYHGWDCASGCIWNLDAIERIERVGTLAKTDRIPAEEVAG